MTKKTKGNGQFAICISNEGSDDLIVWKIYRLLSDKAAATECYFRVVHESGEDYLYPAQRFVVVKFSPEVERRLAAVAR